LDSEILTASLNDPYIKIIYETDYQVVDWINLVQDGIQRRALVKRVMNRQVTYTASNFLIG
jgi:hypothetical protein